MPQCFLDIWVNHVWYLYDLYCDPVTLHNPTVNLQQLLMAKFDGQLKVTFYNNWFMPKETTKKR